ncbi:MAG: TonB-dependent receptor [candidate division KSB1 bacterium]|nr:TonB-dependent receptor [candidate division KSB1 bacterium]
MCDRLLALVLVLLLAAAPLAGSTGDAGSVRGSVVEASTGRPIEGANVVVTGTILGAASDAKGRFIIPKIAPGWYTVVVSSIGYKEVTLEVRVLPGLPTEVNVSLEPTVIELGGLVVTASKYQQTLRDVPASMAIMGAEEISRRSPMTIDEALRFVPGVTTMGSNINIRGASGYSSGIGTRVLVLLDGVPFIRGDDADVDWDAVEPSQVQQVEVMKGAGSALYGSSALGGVVNLVLKEPGSGPRFHARTYTGFYDRPKYDSWVFTNQRRHFEGTALSYATKVRGIGAWLSSSWRNNTGYRENDDIKSYNFMGKFNVRPTPDMRVEVLAGYSKKRTGAFLFWKSYNLATRNGGDPEGTATRSQMRESYLYPSLTHTVSRTMAYSVKGRFLSTASQDYLQVTRPNPSCQEGVYRRSRATTVGGEVQVNYQYSSQTILVAGVDGQRDVVDAIQYGRPSAFKYAAYLQNEYRPWQKALLTLGLRYDAQVYHDSTRVGELNPKVGLTYTVSPLTVVRTSVAKGFRAPSTAERYVSTFANQVKVSPNPDLLPERSVSAELGVNHTMLGCINLDLVAYHSDFWNLIEVRPQPRLVPHNGQLLPEVKFVNVTRARIRGVESALKVELIRDALTGNVGYCYVNSVDLSKNPDGTPTPDYGQVLKYRPRHVLSLSSDLRYHAASAGVDFRYVSRIERVDKMQQLSIKDLDVTPATYVTDLRFALQMGSFKVSFFVNNLFQYYYIEQPAALGPFRHYTLQIDFTS